MGDFYREILIAKKSSPLNGVIRVGSIALCAVCVVLGIMAFWPLLIVGVGLGVLDYFLILPNLDVEYEYQYLNGDIDIDKIMNKQKRKRVVEFLLSELESAAPSGSSDTAMQGKGGQMTVQDFTSGEAGVDSWTLVYNHQGNYTAAVLELDSACIEDLWRRAPRKVQRQR